MAERLMSDAEETEVLESEAVNTTAPVEAETTEVETTEPEQTNYQRFAVSHMTEDQVIQLHAQEKITDDDVQRYLVDQEIRDNFWDMSPEDMEYAIKNDMVTEKQSSAYIANQENAFLFQAKDAAFGVATGLVKLGESVGQVANDVVNALVNPVRHYQGKGFNFFQANITGKDSFAPMTAKGKVAEVAAQFLVPFIGEAKLFTKVTGGAKISAKLLSSKSGKALLAKAPKLAKFMAMGVENAALGMGTDFVAFDPFEPSITEFLEEAGVLPEYMTFMKADPDDPIAWARLKRSMEGAVVGMGVGFAMDFIMGSVKLLKANALKKHAGDVDKIARDSHKVEVEPEIVPPKSETDIDKAEAARIAKLDKKATKEELGKKTDKDVAGTDSTYKSELHPQSAKTRKEAAETIQFIKKGESGKLEFDTSVNLDKLHTPEEVISMIKHQLSKSSEATKAVKGKPLTTAKLSAAAAKIAKEFGDHSPTSVLQFAQEKLGITGLHESAQFINGLTDYVLTLDKQIVDLVKNGTDQADMLKAQYLAEMSGQMLKYLDTASTDAGRLLWSFKRMRESRQSLVNISKEELTELGGLGNNDKLLKLYADLKDPTMKRRLTVKMAQGRAMQGVLEFVQATLVWGMNTFRVNIVGNMMAMTSKAVNQFVGVSVDALKHGDAKRLTGEIGAYFNGLREGIVDSIRFAKGERMGKVWKAWKTGEAQLDASAKFEGQNLHVLKHYAHQAAKLVGIADKGINIADIYTMSFKNLTATDELFKNVNYHTQKHTAIFREAYERHGKKAVKERKALIDTLNKDLPDSIHREAWDNARKNTYTETPGKLTRQMLKVTNYELAQQFGGKAFSFKPLFPLRIVAMPFVNIADNLMRFAGRHTIFSVGTKGFQDAFNAGGARRFEAMSRVGMGTSIILGGYYLHDYGKITGMVPVGDQGKSMYNNWKARNVTPYSFIDKVDGRVTSYAKFAPAALLLSLGANISAATEMFGMREELQLDIDDLLGKILIPALVDPVLEQHYLKSLKDVFDIFAQPERTNLKKALINQVPKFMPFSMLITQAKADLISLGWSEEQGEVWVKEINSITDKIKQIYSEEDLLPMRHHLYGTKIPQVGKTAGAFTVGATQRETDAFEPGTVEEEMGKNGLSMGEMPNRIALSPYATPIELTPELYDELLENVEQGDLKADLIELIESPGYKELPVDDSLGRQLRMEAMRDVINVHRQAAKAKLLEDNPALSAQVDLELKAKVNEMKFKQEVNKAKPTNDMKEFLDNNG